MTKNTCSELVKRLSIEFEREQEVLSRALDGEVADAYLALIEVENETLDRIRKNINRC